MFIVGCFGRILFYVLNLLPQFDIREVPLPTKQRKPSLHDFPWKHQLFFHFWLKLGLSSVWNAGLRPPVVPFSFQYSIFSFWDWPPQPHSWVIPIFWGEEWVQVWKSFCDWGDLKARGFPSLPFCTWSPFVSPLLDASWVARWGLRASNLLSLWPGVSCSQCSCGFPIEREFLAIGIVDYYYRDMCLWINHAKVCATFY